MSGAIRGYRGGNAGGGPPLAQSGQERDRRRDESRLGVGRQIQLFDRAVERKAADRLAEGGVGFGHDGCRGR